MEANVGEDYNNHMLVMYDTSLTYGIDLSSLLLKRKWLVIPKSSQLILFMESRVPKRLSMGKQVDDVVWAKITSLIHLSHQSKFFSSNIICSSMLSVFLASGRERYNTLGGAMKPKSFKVLR
jgi:hypothetical protein